MNKPTTSCSDDEQLWNLLLSDEATDHPASSVQHIAECTRCQTRLEELAADPEEWSTAKDSLTSSDHNTAQNTTANNPRPWERPTPRDYSTAWTDSLTSQLLSPPSHPEMLGRIGRYDVERLIGAGGMGIVFKAFDTELNRPVAVKVLAPHLAGSGPARMRFAREARAAAAVVHEHVVAIHNVETDDKAPFLVMPFVAGESLQQRIDRAGPLELCELLRIAMQTAAGLAAAHAQGLVHRDVKPSNILLEQGVERALLTDFGLARASDDASLTHTGYHPGTPQYMSPEQARGESVDARSDLFSLGSVMYTMCTGRPAFRADTNYGVLRRITDNEPRPIREINPAIPDWLEAIVARLHCKSPGNRLASADQVHDLLEHCLAHVQHPTSVPLPPAVRKLIADSSGPQTGHPHVRKLALTLTCLTAAGLLLGPGQHFFNANHSNPQPPDSTQAPASEQPTATAQPSTTEQPTAAQPPHRSHDANPQTAWDGPATDISSYHRELSDFEARSQLPWDKLPAANDQPTTTQQTPPDDR